MLLGSPPDMVRGAPPHRTRAPHDQANRVGSPTGVGFNIIGLYYIIPESLGEIKDKILIFINHPLDNPDPIGYNGVVRGA